jgi:hypothetical protein
MSFKAIYNWVRLINSQNINKGVKSYILKCLVKKANYYIFCVIKTGKNYELVRYV